MWITYVCMSYEEKHHVMFSKDTAPRHRLRTKRKRIRAWKQAHRLSKRIGKMIWSFFVVGHPCFGGYLSHRRRPSTMQNKTKSIRERKDTTRYYQCSKDHRRQNGTIVSCKYDSRWCVSLAALVSQPPCEGYSQTEQWRAHKTSSFHFDFARHSTKTRGSIANNDGTIVHGHSKGSDIAFSYLPLLRVSLFCR